MEVQACARDIPGERAKIFSARLQCLGFFCLFPGRVENLSTSLLGIPGCHSSGHDGREAGSLALSILQL